MGFARKNYYENKLLKEKKFRLLLTRFTRGSAKQFFLRGGGGFKMNRLVTDCTSDVSPIERLTLPAKIY